eukprot:CAMPEP_0201281172 /NCGR_PEP_ID=MMETSP1317-20130820/1804_1 /ASSEMBLY_ACC=CAM_ASM_000770 /TAXON_ID=187299 /ORGANISM="Undescribed Undescribed, Strain Undescribed" /LENGTH=77 /DNA_ID=CAMNT_0047590377 /DNA_START=382 /DNA_END=615 /DNA_ORIENTATION=+
MALRLRARNECVDREGVKRKAGEEWLVSTEGAYLPNIDEVVVDRLKAFVITDILALHLRATRTFNDAYNKLRKAGEE